MNFNLSIFTKVVTATLSVAVSSTLAIASSSIRVACIGDSITYGASIKNRVQNCYPSILKSKLGENYIVSNFGVNGATMLKKGDKPYWKTKNYAKAIEFQPNVIIIKLGTNDTKPQNWRHKAEFKANYLEMIKTFQALPSRPTVFICKPAPVFKGNFTITQQVMDDEVRPLIDEVAKESGVNIIDLYTPLKDQKSLLPDNVHPNAKGADIMASAVFDTISNMPQQSAQPIITRK